MLSFLLSLHLEPRLCLTFVTLLTNRGLYFLWNGADRKELTSVCWCLCCSLGWFTYAELVLTNKQKEVEAPSILMG